MTRYQAIQKLSTIFLKIDIIQTPFSEHGMIQLEANKTYKSLLTWKEKIWAAWVQSLTSPLTSFVPLGFRTYLCPSVKWEMQGVSLWTK